MNEVCLTPFNLMEFLFFNKPVGLCIRAETDTRFARIFAQLHDYSNAMKVFGYTSNDFGTVILGNYLYILSYFSNSLNHILCIFSLNQAFCY